MASPVKKGLVQAKPILSVTHGEARRRVIKLYKSWYRQIPFILMNYALPKNEQDCKAKLRQEFMKNAHVRDVRVIDALLIKGQMELQEVLNQWKPAATLLNYWNDTRPPKPTDFMSKFLRGHE
ncbi:NADH dehydrogenase (ubiquinone) B14 subunit [Xylocopa sonorina]|uniref:NADH dehydrogenase (ubiquinone) B14 subunit n=1 Tax=Xylocopa sonorina TaxID=1818115 RepID=UPI00403A849B